MDRLMSGIRKAGSLLLLMALVCALTPQTTRSKYVLEETVGTFTVEVTVPADAGLTALPPDALVPDDPQQGVQEPETGGTQQDTQGPETGGGPTGHPGAGDRGNPAGHPGAGDRGNPAGYPGAGDRGNPAGHPGAGIR